jgi:hypothetical protein
MLHPYEVILLTCVDLFMVLDLGYKLSCLGKLVEDFHLLVYVYLG